ncbi:MAG: hypothetical protein KJ600_03660 [Nanoarchaeota archaeon]|nr:hypothetical protein [Nanoarchaeota archaeon]MBU1103624.1 hypothetical protein [Nanoarchaeota archaeon]
MEKGENKKIQKEETKKKKTQKVDKELYWVLGVMVALILVFLISSAIFESSKDFQYQGLEFTKEMFGEIPLYRFTYFTDTSSSSITGHTINSGANRVIVLLRGDPRKNNVPVYGEIEYLPKENFVYVSINSTGLLCEDSTIAMAGIASFMKQNGFTIKGGSADEADAEQTGLDYITCENRPGRMVILLQSGPENSITREGDCYTLNVADCEVLPVTERFLIQSVLDAKAE